MLCYGGQSKIWHIIAHVTLATIRENGVSINLIIDNVKSHVNIGLKPSVDNRARASET